MIKTEVKVDENIIRRLRVMDAKIQESTQVTVNEIGRWTRDRLKLFIPNKTGESARSIIVENIVNTKKRHSLWIKMSFVPHNKIWNGQNFYLPQWFMQSELARREQRRYSGNINEYRNVVPEAKRTFGIRIRDDIKNATRTK